MKNALRVCIFATFLGATALALIHHRAKTELNGAPIRDKQLIIT